MSELCLFELKDKSISFKQYNKLAKKLVRFALNEDLGIFFNSYDYTGEIALVKNMKNFFTVSDSFIYQNCDFLNNSEFLDIVNSKDAFFRKYGFLSEILNIVFMNSIKAVNVYFTEDETANKEDDFIIKKTTSKSFMVDLFMSIIEYADRFAYEFPTIKFEVVP